VTFNVLYFQGFFSCKESITLNIAENIFLLLDGNPQFVFNQIYDLRDFQCQLLHFIAGHSVIFSVSQLEKSRFS